jgi:quercetin dioxygenase-like cupin family protein
LGAGAGGAWPPECLDALAALALAGRWRVGLDGGMEIRRLDVRRFEPGKMQKVGLFETERFFCDVYCLEVGQEQKPHAHAGADKVYAVLEGEVAVRVGEEERRLGTGEAVLAPAGVDHGVKNPGPGRAALLVFMTPRP